MLGNCTNTVFPDEGMPDVFAISTEKLTKLFLLPDGAIYAEAGVPLSRLAAFAQQNALAGLEFASGIPGTVGGGLMMNAGAYGGEMKDAVESVVCYYLPEQRLYEVTAEKCGFEYRSSFFQKIPGNVILSAVFRLAPGDKDRIAAKNARAQRAPPRKSSRSTSPPRAAPSSARRTPRRRAHRRGGAEGLLRRRRAGQRKHAGFVVNTGSATAADVHELLKQVRKRVYDHSQVLLEPEIILYPPDYKLEDRGPQVPRNKFVDTGVIAMPEDEAQEDK